MLTCNPLQSCPTRLNLQLFVILGQYMANKAAKEEAEEQAKGGPRKVGLSRSMTQSFTKAARKLSSSVHPAPSSGGPTVVK